MTSLEGELARLPEALRAELDRHRFDASRLILLAKRLVQRSATDNHVKGQLASPPPGDLVDLESFDAAAVERFRARGLSMLAGGKVALVVLAGGMATRMGGVVKALVEALPGRTFLDLRLAEQQTLERAAGHDVPLWLMTSAATDEKIRIALGSKLDGDHVAVFPQALSLRVTEGGELFRDAAGSPSHHAPGHGDLVDSLRASGLLDRFLASGGTTVTVANLDNLGATLDPVILGLHAEHGLPVTCEVVDKLPTDRGGIPVAVDGRTVVLEEFRIPPHFDPKTVRVFSTNTFHFDAKALAQTNFPWTYFVVEKKVDGKPAIQFERLINEVTSHLATRYLRVPRTGAASRFLPVKDNNELSARHGEIEAVARARGMLP